MNRSSLSVYALLSMWRTLNISEPDWQQTPPAVQNALLSLAADRHALKLRAAAAPITAQVEQLKRLVGRQQRQTQRWRHKLAETKQLRVDNARLSRKVAALTERLRQNLSSSSLPPSAASPFGKRTNNAEPSGRRPSAQPRHLGAGRYLLDIKEVDKNIKIAPLFSSSNCAPLLN